MQYTCNIRQLCCQAVQDAGAFFIVLSACSITVQQILAGLYLTLFQEQAVLLGPRVCDRGITQWSMVRTIGRDGGETSIIRVGPVR